MDLGVLAEQAAAAVVHALDGVEREDALLVNGDRDLAGALVQMQALKVDAGLANLVVHANVVVHDLDPQLHVVEGRQLLPVEVLVVGGVASVALVRRFLATVVLVQESVVLLQLELDVRVRAAQAIAIDEVGYVDQFDGQDSHDVAVVVGCSKIVLDKDSRNNELQLLSKIGVLSHPNRWIDFA